MTAHNPSGRPRKANPSPTPKRKSSQRAPRTIRKKSRGFWGRLIHIPAWTLWTGAVLVSMVYATLFYVFFVSPFSFRWKAIYGEPVYPEGYDIRGLDISHYQTSIQWEKLRNASIQNDPIRFIFIKATAGTTLLDDNFTDNFYQARQNDFIRGANHFCVPDADPTAQARFFLHQVHLEPGDLPPVLDVEKCGSLSPDELQKRVLTWLRIVERRYGVKPILYTSHKFREKYLSTPEFDAYPYWIAHYYVSKLAYKGTWAFWQHTDCGTVDGIKGHVDCNIFNGTLKQLTSLTLQEEEEEEEDGAAQQ